MRSERCVCGGYILARSLREAASAVARHNLSLTHVVWRYNREGPTARVTVCDVSGPSARASAPPGRFS
jgi:hypothetical protein